MILCHVSITVKVNHYITTYGDKHITRNDVYIDMILAYIYYICLFIYLQLLTNILYVHLNVHIHVYCGVLVNLKSTLMT